MARLVRKIVCGPNQYHWGVLLAVQSRLGPAQAAVATAHKMMAQVVYHMLKFKVEYQASSAAEYDQWFRERAMT